ncbi:MAG: hypothetical protein H5U02_00340 [Clostridia bacterium]|nr:hypothetical protein [Clostridia bacterium]
MALVAVERARYGKRIEKAGGGELWRRIIGIADAAVPDVERAFLAAVAAARQETDLDKLAQAVERGDAEAALAAAGMSAFEEKFAEKMEELMREIAASAGRMAMQDLAGKIPGAVAKAAPKGPRLALSFDMRNPRSLQWIAAHGAELVAGVGQNTKDAIKVVVRRAFEEGGHPYEQAKQIRQMIGLDPRRAAALANYERAQLGQGIDPAEVQKRVDKYREKLLKQRAQMIARTETIAAACEGQREAWRQAVDSGLLVEEEWERKWIVTPDDRLCPLCMAREDKRAQVHGAYPDGSGGPPLHPGCRCAEGLVRVKPPSFREKPEAEVEVPEVPEPLSAAEIDYAKRMVAIWNGARGVDDPQARITLAVAEARGITKPAAVMESGEVDAAIAQGWAEYRAVLSDVDEDIEKFLGERLIPESSPYVQMAGVWIDPKSVERSVAPPAGVFRVVIDPAAKIAEWDDIAKEMAERNQALDMARRLREAGLGEAAEIFEHIGNVPSAYAAFMGYDGVKYGKYGARICMVNRSMMRIQRTPLWGKAVEARRLWEPVGPKIKGRDLAPKQAMSWNEAEQARSALKDMFVGEWPRLKRDEYDERFADGEQRAYAKDTLVKHIARRLSRDEALEAAKFIRGTEAVDAAVAERVGIQRIAYSAVNDIVHQWAVTSGDNSSKSIAMQKVAMIEFGIDAPTDHWPDYTSEEADKLVNGYGRAVARILREMYNWTQKELKRRGIDKVVVYRGHTFRTEEAPQWLRSASKGQAGKVSLQPLNSFSRIYEVAESFSWPSEGEIGYVFAAAIPRERIISTCRTGYGCLTEAELVVLGGKDKEVTVELILPR